MSAPLRGRAADLVGRILLDEVPALDANALLVGERRREVAPLSGNECAFGQVDPEIGNARGLRKPRVDIRDDGVSLRGLAALDSRMAVAPPTKFAP